MRVTIPWQSRGLCGRRALKGACSRPAAAPFARARRTNTKNTPVRLGVERIVANGRQLNDTSYHLPKG